MSVFEPMSLSDAAAWITVPQTNDDKYRRGVLGAVTGSTSYPGAAAIGVDAAVHTGIGMVRYVGPDRVADHVLRVRPETVTGIGRVQAWLIGSGTAADRLDESTRHGIDVAAADSSPMVVDAGALSAVPLEERTVITPHAGELARLLNVERSSIETDPASAALRAAEHTGATVLLKGSTTHIATPDGAVRLAASSATPWLATAGAGDALGGVLGALVAARAARGPVSAPDLAHLAAAAAVIHGTAAVRASAGGPFPIAALIAQLPGVIADLALGRV